MKVLPLFVALALLVGCSQSPREKASANQELASPNQELAHAKEVALHSFDEKIELPSSYDAASLVVEPFSAAQVKRYINEKPSHHAGYLVLYDVTVRLQKGEKKSREAALVTAQDSVFAFYPFRHVAEFNRRYGTRY